MPRDAETQRLRVSGRRRRSTAGPCRGRAAAWQQGVTVLVAAGMVVSSALVGAVVSTPDAVAQTGGVGSGGLRELKPILAPVGFTNVPIMLHTDLENRVGFAYGFWPDDSQGLAVYDLKTPELVHKEQYAAPGQGSGGSSEGDLNPLFDIGHGGGTFPVPYPSIDTKRRRMWVLATSPATPQIKQAENLRCATGVTPPSGLASGGGYFTALDYRNDAGVWSIKTTREIMVPCLGPLGYRMLSHSYDRTSDTLVSTGVLWADNLVHGGKVTNLVDSHDMGPEARLVRQFKFDTAGNLVPDWTIDLYPAGCFDFARPAPGSGGAFDTRYSEPPFAQRWGDPDHPEIVAYCWDRNSFSEGPNDSTNQVQGFVIRVPLDPVTGRPLPPPGVDPAAAIDPTTGLVTAYQYRIIPTMPGKVDLTLDKASGRLIVVTRGATIGVGAWVFDLRQERFVGVITGGASDEPYANVAFGLDPVRGIGYLLSRNGIVRADIRSDPLTGGRLFPVLRNDERVVGFASAPGRIAVDPVGRRLYVAVSPPGAMLRRPASSIYSLRVVADETLEPPEPPPYDPDINTAQVREEPGVTEARTRGQAGASGLRLVVAGGMTRTAQQVDFACTRPPVIDINLPSIERAAFNACVADQAIAPGYREYISAATDVEAISDTQAVAHATSFAPGEKDLATANDLKRVGSCQIHLFPYLTRGNFPQDQQDEFDEHGEPRDDNYAGGCKQFWDAVTGQGEASSGNANDPRLRAPDPRQGTDGRDGKGFPLRRARCLDFGGDPGSANEPPTSSVACDASKPTATAVATGSGLTVADPDDPSAPVVSVGATWSRTTSFRTVDQGQVTRAEARVNGLQVGPLRIAELRSWTETNAKGVAGTTATEFHRRWCGVEIMGQATVPGCVDPDDPESGVEQLIPELNNRLLGKVRLSVPGVDQEATDGGFQATVAKDESERNADKAVNDDDGTTASALQVTVFNDGGEGRNRYILQLAGVTAESRYGISILPRFGGGVLIPPDLAPSALLEPAPVVQGGSVTAPPVLTTPPVLATSRPAPGSDEFIVYDAIPASSAPLAEPSGGGGGLRNLITGPLQAVEDLLRLIVQHPREFALLFALFSLMAAPAYFTYRRRQFERAVAV